MGDRIVWLWSEKAIVNMSWSYAVSSVNVSPPPALDGKHCAHRGIYVPSVALGESKTPAKKKKVSVTGCFTIPFPCFPFCHFSIILGISVRQALFLKLPLFHRFLYFMISTSSSSVVQTEVEAWGNQAATVTCKPQAARCGTCMICQFS